MWFWSLLVIVLAIVGYSTISVLAQTITGWILGVKVLRASVGFGPRLFGFDLGETEFRFSWFPLGGYTRFWGEQPYDEISDEDGDGSYSRLSHANKVVVLASGPSSNIALAFLVLVMSLVVGRQEPTFIDQAARVAWCRPGSALHKAGLAPGDEVVSANYGGATVQVESWRGFLRILANATGSTLSLGVKRGKSSLTISAQLDRSALADVCHQVDPVLGEIDEDSLAYEAGFRPGDRVLTIDDKPIKHWFDMPPELYFFDPRPDGGWVRRDRDVKVRRGARTLTMEPPRVEADGDADPMQVAGFVSENLVTQEIRLGPGAAVARTLRDLAESVNASFRVAFRRAEWASEFDRRWPRHPFYKGLTLYLFTLKGSRLVLLFAYLGFMLGMLNLLPIPSFSGGQILLELLQAVRGRPVSPRAQDIATYTGLALMITFSLYVVCK